MIVSCPSCKARYLVPASHFVDGARQVRCARCTHTWAADPAAAQVSANFAQQLSALSPVEAKTSPPLPPPVPTSLPVVTHSTRPFWAVDWVLASVALVLSLAMLFGALERRDIAARWP